MSLPLLNSGKGNRHRHNKALHPTTHSFARSSLRFLRRVSLVVGPLVGETTANCQCYTLNMEARKTDKPLTLDTETEVTAAEAADLKAAIQQLFEEMEQVDARIESNQADIEKLRAETRAMLAELWTAA